MALLATSVRVVHESYCPDIGPICNEREEPPQLHDQRFSLGELRARVEYGLTAQWGLELQLPVRLNYTTVQFRRLDGTPVTLDYVNIHHRDETLFGLGDPWVRARYGFGLGGVDLMARAGFTVPVGGTVENPFALGEAGQEHQHVQFGTGTVQPLLALEAERRWDGGWSVRGYGQAQLALVENRYGYRNGSRFSVGVSGELPVVGALRLSAGADLANEQPERWDGRVQQDGNLGRTDVLVGGGVTYPVGRVQLGLTVRVPVYQHIIGHHGQLTYPGLLGFTAETVFGE